MDAPEKLQSFQDVTGMSDPQQCIAILEAHDWDLDAAVGTIFAATSGEREEREREEPLAGPSSYGGALLRSRNNGAASSSVPQWTDMNGNGGRRSSSSSGSVGIASYPQETSQGAGLPPGRSASFRETNNSVVWRAVSVPFWMVSRSFKIVKGAVALGLWLVGGVLSTSLTTVGSVATYLAGGTQPYGRLPQPQSDSTLFVQRFEAEYGNVHPSFVNLTFLEAVRSASEQLKFLFVYLHSPEHVNTPSFCHNTLCSEGVTQFINENFVSWGGDVRSTEGYQMSNSLKAPTYPFCAVVTGSTNQRVALLQQMEGPVSPDFLISQLQKVIDEQGAMLVAARVEAEELLVSRRLREEQDAAYQAALLADQERERKNQEEADRLKREADENERRRREEEIARETLAQKVAEQEAAMKRHRVEKAAKLGEEPEKGPDVTQVVVRLPGGERKERRFNSVDFVELVYDYVDSLGLLQSTNYSLVTNFPRTVYGPETRGKSLREAGLHPHASLFVQEHDS